jgi:hypothetical protein
LNYIRDEPDGQLSIVKVVDGDTIEIHDGGVIALLWAGCSLRASVVEDEDPLLQAEDPALVQLHSETADIRTPWTAVTPASEVKILIVGWLEASK